MRPEERAEASTTARRWRLPRLPLRTKVLLAFAVVLMPLLLLLLAEFRASVNAQIAHALDAEEVVAEAFASQVDAMFDAAMGLGWAVAGDPLVRGFDQDDRLDQHLQRIAVRHRLFERVAAYDALGNNRGWGDRIEPAEPRVNIADEEYFRAVLTTNSATLSEVIQMKRPAGAMGIVAAVPIRDDADRVIGVVTVVMSTTGMAKEYEEARIRAGQTIILADRTGRLAFHSGRRTLTDAESLSYSTFAEVHRAIAGASSTTREFVSPILGDVRLGAFVPTKGYHWAVGVTTPREVALAPMYAGLWRQMLGLGAILLLSVGLALVGARRLMTPVRRLQAHARALGAGDLAHRADIRTGDELEDLGTAFNEMAERIQQLLAREQAARAQAEAASRAKDQFMAMVSHELRTPLTPVMTAVELLRRLHPQPKDAPELLDLIHRNIELEARLIDDLLDLTRLTQARMQLRPEVVDAHALIRQVTDIFRGAVATKRLRVELDLSAPGHHVHGDSGRLQQIFWNLIGNAVKFTPADGMVRVRTLNGNDEGEARRHEGTEAPCALPPTLTIEVTDNGIGIEAEVMERLFRPFEQGDQSRTRRFGGLGLGLCISKGLAEMHGGRIEVRSEGKGKGTTFTVTLPLTAAPAADAMLPAAEPDGHKPRLSILLVDDNEDTLRMLSSLLRHMGHAVRTATSAQEALKADHDQHFDLLISDIGLPDTTGWELMRQLRGRRPIRGIALSGFGTDDDIRQSQQAGFDDHLTKPVNVGQLEEMIGRVREARN